jgi:curved DNA-binding protein CbpA
MGVRPMTETDHYKMLEVDPEADPDVIEAAYHALSRKLHPDGDPTGKHRVMQSELDHAFAILSNSTQRRAYDARRAEEWVAVGPGVGNGQADVRRLAAGTLSERVQAGLDGETIGSLKLDFGRYAGHTLTELVNVDPDYLRWLCRHSSGIRYRRAIMRLLADREDARTPLHVQS